VDVNTENVDLIVVGGRLKSDPPSLLLFGCEVADDAVTADAYLVLRPLRKGTKPRVNGIGGRVTIPTGLKPDYIKWESIRLQRHP